MLPLICALSVLWQYRTLPNEIVARRRRRDAVGDGRENVEAVVPREVRRGYRDLDERARRFRQRSVQPQQILGVGGLVGRLQRQRRLVPLKVAHVAGREVLRSLPRAVGRRCFA